MPSAAIVHAAVFTAGALLGGGLAVAVSNNNKRAVAAPPYTPAQQTPAARVPVPVIGLDPQGKTSISNELTITSNLPAVLKYGNPGASDHAVRPFAHGGADAAVSVHRTYRGHAGAQGICCGVRQAPAPSGMGAWLSYLIPARSTTRLTLLYLPVCRPPST